MGRNLHLLLVVLLSACSKSEPTHEPACLSEETVSHWKRGDAALDLLFVVDAAPGMEPHIARLREAMPHLVERLMSPRRLQNGTGPNKLLTFSDLHVGVVSADLGGDAALGCSAHGQQGILQPAPECDVAAGSFSAFADGALDNDSPLAHLDCQLAALGSSCQQAQPLEAALQALWPPPPGMRVDTPPLEFASGAAPHGQRENLGFVRGASHAAQLLVVIVTNRDDCSMLAARDAIDPQDVPGCFGQTALLAGMKRYVRTLNGPHWATVGTVTWPACHRT